MDTHRLPPGAVVLEGPAPSVLGRLVRWRLGSPWGHCWMLVDAWTGIEADWGGVRVFDPRDRFAQLEAGRAFVIVDRAWKSGVVSDAMRAKVAEVAPKFVGHGYHWVQAIWWALTRQFFVDRARHLICSFLPLAIERAAYGGHGFEWDAGKTAGAERRRRGLVTPADFLSSPEYHVICSVPGQGEWAVRDQPPATADNPWADKYPVGSPRPER